MNLCVVEESGTQLLVPTQGKLPAHVVALRGSGYARFSLLPSVALEAASGMDDAQIAEALASVRAHRDTLLAAWMPENQEHFPQPHVAESVRCQAVAFDAASRSLRMRMRNGAQLAYSLRQDPVLGTADDAQLAEVELLCEGEFLRWPKLNRYERVPDLVLALTGFGPPLTAARRAPGAPVGSAPTGPGPAKSLLGLILYREGFVTREQLQGVFQEQMRLHKQGTAVPFGQLAVNAGFLTPDQLRMALNLQDRLANAGGEAKAIALHLVESATIKPSALLAALMEQEQTGQRLEEMLHARGLLTDHQLSVYRQRQPGGQEAPKTAPAPVQTGPTESEMSKTVPAVEPKAEAPKAPPQAVPVTPPPPPVQNLVKSLLGIILEREDYLNQVQVKAIVAEQEKLKAQGKTSSFGELALTLGYITQDQLKFAIQLQKKLAYAPGQMKPLGAILLENGVVKPSQIHLALQKQQATGAKLGQLLIDEGVLSESLLEVFLRMQEQTQA